MTKNNFVEEVTFKVCGKSENHLKNSFHFYIFSFVFLGVE